MRVGCDADSGVRACVGSLEVAASVSIRELRVPTLIARFHWEASCTSPPLCLRFSMADTNCSTPDPHMLFFRPTRVDPTNRSTSTSSTRKFSPH